MRRTATVIALAASLSGCGPAPAGPRSHPATHPSPTATNEVRPQIQPSEAVAATAPAPDPRAVIRAFVGPYVNWTAATLASHLRSLAASSIGQARSTIVMAGARAEAGAGELRRRGIVNAGTVETIAPRTGHTGQWILVTRERTSARRSAAFDGLEASWHVTVVTLTAIQGVGWVVSGWQPES